MSDYSTTVTIPGIVTENSGEQNGELSQKFGAKSNDCMTSFSIRTNFVCTVSGTILYANKNNGNSIFVSYSTKVYVVHPYCAQNKWINNNIGTLCEPCAGSTVLEHAYTRRKTKFSETDINNNGL